MIKERCWFSQINFFVGNFPHRINVVSFQPILCHPHTQIRIMLSRGVRISIPNWKPSPNRTSIGFSQVAFPITVLPKDDHTDSAQEERRCLPYWTMIWAICALADVSKYLDILILEFCNDVGAASILTRVQADAASAACPEHPGSLDVMSMTFAAVI